MARMTGASYEFISEEYRPADRKDLERIDREILELAKIMSVNGIKKIELTTMDVKEFKIEESKEAKVRV